MQVHYGRASLSQLSRLPAYFVFPRSKVDAAAITTRIKAAACAASAAGKAALLTLLDQSYAHVLPTLNLNLTEQAIQQALTGQRSTSEAASGAIADDGNTTTAQSAGSSSSPATIPIILADLSAGPRDPAGVSEKRHKGGLPPPSTGGCCSRGNSSGVESSKPCCQAATVQIPDSGISPPDPDKGSAQQSAPHSAELSTHSSAEHSGGHVNAHSPESVPSQAKDDSSVETTPQLRALHSSVDTSGRYSEGIGGGASSPEGLEKVEVAGMTWQLPAGVAMADVALLWVGDLGAAVLTQLQLTYNSSLWTTFDPATGHSEEVCLDGRIQLI